MLCPFCLFSISKLKLLNSGESFFLSSLRVNLDMGKAAYGWMIMKDDNIPGTVVRTSTIPEELGRLVYLLTDKTGTSWKCILWMKFIQKITSVHVY